MASLPVPIPVPTTPTQRARALVVDSVNSPESKRAYARGIDEFIDWFHRTKPDTGFSKASVQAFRAHLVERGLAASTLNLWMTAVRRLAAEAADNSLIKPEIALGIARVKGARRQGVRIGNWLTVPLAEALLNEPDTQTLKGKRDRALLAVMLGCGLRREETARLKLEHIQQRDGRWVIVDLIGKGGRVRSVPMPSWAKAAIDVWVTSAGFTTGALFRPVNKGDHLAGEQHDRTSCLQHGQDVCGSDRDGPLCAARLAPVVCQTRAQRTRATRADPTVARTCVHSDDREVFGSRTGFYRCPLRPSGLENLQGRTGELTWAIFLQ